MNTTAEMPRQPITHAGRAYKAAKDAGTLPRDAVKARACFEVIIESATACELKNMGVQRQEPGPVAEARIRICSGS